MFEKPSTWKKKKYRDAARGQSCTMCLPCCNHDPDTTVLAHANGAGMSMKSPDYNAADMCSSCHDVFDGRSKMSDGQVADLAFNLSLSHTQFQEKDLLLLAFNHARYRTIVNRIKRGIIK